MTATTGRRIGSIAAGALLALGLLVTAPVAGASPADREFDCEGPEDGDHPSGPGRSGTQGASSSDPDGDGNGGADKPGCDGGFDAHDRDGNNGCGNDHDFEDDNNGWCGRKPAGEERDRNEARVQADRAAPALVAGAQVAAPDAAEVAEPAVAEPAVAEPATEVLGVTVERPDTLARTGLGLGGLALAGGTLLGTGRLAALIRRLSGRG